MGKGGSSTAQSSAEEMIWAPIEGRGFMSNTIPEPSEITKRSLREAIPAHCFKRSYAHSLGAFAWDVAVALFSMWAVHQANAMLPWYAAPLAWGFYWYYQGLTFTGLWVLAHECGHGGFTDSRAVNDAVGYLIHSVLLTPYFSWAITHAKHHHYTNHISMGETWVPSTANPEKRSVKEAKTVYGTLKRITIIAVMGWYSYLLFNATGARQNLGQSHFNPHAKALFKKKDVNYVRASTAGVLFCCGLVLAAMGEWGVLEVARTYLIPQMIANFYLCAITFLQHTHEDVPHFNDDHWTWLRGALSTIDRSMGSFADYKTHYIVPSHVVHHIFSDMPYYGAMEATPYVKAHLGKFYKEAMPTPVLGSVYLGYWRDFFTAMRSSVSVVKEADGFLWFH